MHPPTTEAVLRQRASALTGLTLGALATQMGWPIPATLHRHKGWVGALLEHLLGAQSGSRPQPDFPQLGIELKTIPLNAHGKPLESTFVCVAELADTSGLQWHTSLVWRKLRRVLWVPIIGDRALPPTARSIGTPYLWSPDARQAQVLRQDWEELMEYIVLGQVERISAYQGEVLQLRPKAANGRVRTAAVGHLGQPIRTLPLGFYLRATFTAQLSAQSARLHLLY